MTAPTAETLSARAAVLVEGVSDQLALEALARRRGRDLAAEGVSVIAMRGATNIARFLDRLGPRGSGLRLAGLYDVGEEVDFKRALEASFGAELTRAGMERLGFYACVVDLEDELIRSLGVEAAESVLEAQGDLAAFRTFQNQPDWRARDHAEQLRRFMGTKGGRKIQTAARLVEALDLAHVPRPLDEVLAHV